MVLLSRQIEKLQKRDDIDVAIFPDFDDLLVVAHEILSAGNKESGRKTTLIFGIDSEGKIRGISGNERLVKNQIMTFMNIFKPMVDYVLETRYNPSDYKIIYYLQIKPTLRRFFYPHSITYNLEPILHQLVLDDFNSSLQDILENRSTDLLPFGSMINRFTGYHLEGFKEYQEETKSLRLNRIVDSIHFFETRTDLFAAIRNIGLEALLLHDVELFSLKCIGRIFSLLDLEDDFAKEIVINRLQHLFKILPEGVNELQSHINFFIRDIIIGEDAIFQVEINEYNDLIKFLQVLSAIGIAVNLDQVIKHIELESSVQEKIRKIDEKKQKIWDDDLLAKIFIIFAPYFESNDTPVKSRFRFSFKRKKSNKSRLKKLIEERDRIFRPVKSNGRHDRDNKLAMLMKDYYGFECQSCGSRRTSITTITVSHRVPLYFSVEFGGIDRSCNMEVLCRFCHDRWEAKFDKMVFENENLISKQDLLEFLMKEFPENFSLNQ